MRQLIVTILLSFSLVFAITLSDYVAKFDKELAIQLYESDLEIGHDVQASYTALARLYNETGKIGLAEDCYRHLIDIHNGSEESYHSYLDFLFENDSYDKLRHIIAENGFSHDWSQYLVARSYFKEAKFDSSLLFTENLPEDLAGRLHRYSLEGVSIKKRSPALGGIMSAIIPGSGKVYAGRLLDGMQAFSVVLAPAYNAYYHFRKTGPTSARAWIWTAVASWFYLSDIYGSVKAVREYNEMQQFKIIERYEQ